MRHLSVAMAIAAIGVVVPTSAQSNNSVDFTLTGQIPSECRLESPSAAEQTVGSPRLGLRTDGELTARFKIECNSPVVGEFKLENGMLAHVDANYQSAVGGLANVPVRVSVRTGMAVGDGQFDGTQLTAPKSFSSGDQPVFDQEIVFRIAWDKSDRYYAGRYRDVLHLTLQAVP